MNKKKKNKNKKKKYPEIAFYVINEEGSCHASYTEGKNGRIYRNESVKRKIATNFPMYFPLKRGGGEEAEKDIK